MGDYIDLKYKINKLKITPDHTCKNEILKSSSQMISASDQAMAETIILMNTAAMENGHPVFCVPRNFSLDGKAVAHLMMQGYNESTLPIAKKGACLL